MASSVYSRTLQQAAELIGGRAKLCRYLRVPMAELQRWIDDKAAPPIGIFLRAVDFIIDSTPAPGGGTDSSGETPSHECSAHSGSSASWL